MHSASLRHTSTALANRDFVSNLAMLRRTSGGPDFEVDVQEALFVMRPVDLDAMHLQDFERLVLDIEVLFEIPPPNPLSIKLSPAAQALLVEAWSHLSDNGEKAGITKGQA